jgi:zinc/manganese transport system substrate-binding protein
MQRFLRAASIAFLFWAGPAWPAPPQDAAPIAIVAAENFYGDVAQQIGGAQVKVTSIISAPGQDPHQFEASPSIARDVANAAIVVLNGADYDPWVEKLLAGTPSAQRAVIIAADLLKRKPGDNPHLWYEPATMPAVATAIANELSRRDAAHADLYAMRLKTFLDSLAPIDTAIRSIRSRYAGAPVSATEPVFGYMAQALGFVMRNERFQLAVMNETEPSARDVAALQDDLRGHRVRILFYNAQVSGDLSTRLLAVARAAGVPVVGVTETKPADKTYQQWIAGELEAVSKALEGGGT